MEIALVDWQPWILEQVKEARLEAEARAQGWSRAKRRWEVCIDSGGGAAPKGDARIAEIRARLDSFEGFARSEAQKRFHVSFLQSLLPHIYGSVDFERHRERILRENDMKEVTYDTLVCTPRRFGKTTAISMLCAVLMACCPDMWISVFSTGQRASSALLEQTAKFFFMLDNKHLCRGSKDNCLKKNQVGACHLCVPPMRRL